MNATLATPTAETRHPVQPLHPLPVRRVGLVDRAALHLGVALIKWGRRPAASAATHERRANRLERALARNRREAHVAAQREAAFTEYALMTRIR
jgi:hypothetical protein